MSHLSQTFDPEAASVSVARQFVRQALRDLGADGAVDTAQTLVSEAGHQRGDPCPHRLHGTDATTGRGLRLVDALASGWGVETQADGKAVWFEVPADGEDGATDADAWTEVADVDALLAPFDDGSHADVRTLVRAGSAVTVGLARRAA